MDSFSLVLASASPRRLELLAALGVDHVRVLPADVDETPLKGELPSAYVLRMAQEKAQKAHCLLSDQQISGRAFVLGADTIVALGRRIFQKARDEVEARAQITLFSGRRHRVYTGVALVTPQGTLRTRVVCTRVAMKRLSALEVEAFLKSREWEGVCGYRLQGMAGAFISWLNGAPSTILGLPLYETAQLLQGNGYPLWSPKQKLGDAL